jgi:hypothetical protein
VNKRTVLIVTGIVATLVVVVAAAVLIGSNEEAQSGKGSHTGSKKSPKPARFFPSVASPSGAASPNSPQPMQEVTLHAYNVTLPNSGTAGDNGIRILVDSPGRFATVRLHGGVPANNKTVLACPVSDLKTPFVLSACEAPASDKDLQVPLGERYKGIELVLIGDGPVGSKQVTIGQIQVSYQAVSGLTQVRTPPIEVQADENACNDNGCNPFFEFTPQAAGRLVATAKLEDTSLAQLALESGNISAHALTSSGKPYKQIDAAEGEGKLKVSGKIHPDREVALSLRNTGSKVLAQAYLNIVWR